jgi:DNA-binding winged helix-turn-helix (wHTH) protein
MPQEAKHFYEFSSFRLDAARRVLFMQGTPLLLQPKVFNTLLVLVERRGQVVEKDDLMKLLWPDSFVEEANLTQRLQLRINSRAVTNLQLRSVANLVCLFLSGIE